MRHPRVVWVHVRVDRKGDVWTAVYTSQDRGARAVRRHGGELVRYERAVEHHRVVVRGFARTTS